MGFKRVRYVKAIIPLVLALALVVIVSCGGAAEDEAAPTAAPAATTAPAATSRARGYGSVSGRTASGHNRGSKYSNPCASAGFDGHSDVHGRARPNGYAHSGRNGRSLHHGSGNGQARRQVRRRDRYARRRQRGPLEHHGVWLRRYLYVAHVAFLQTAWSTTTARRRNPSTFAATWQPDGR